MSKHPHDALSPQLVDRLLQLLASNSGFRRQFRSDPIAALYQLGYQPHGPDDTHAAQLEALRASLSVQTLAPKQAIAAAHAQLRDQLTGELAMIPIQLNVASTASRRLRK